MLLELAQTVEIRLQKQRAEDTEGKVGNTGELLLQ